MERLMTAVTNPLLENFKDAFSPVTDALKNFAVPESAREFVKKTTNTAKERTADFHAGSERMTSMIENAASGSVSEAAKISRNIQQAVYEDAEALFAGIDKLASATSLSEAVQIQSDLVRASGETFASRAKSATEYFGKLVTESAKTAQDNLSKVYTKTA
jgi:phasin